MAIKVRVGQQNGIKITSSISGSAGGVAVVAENVVGGIGSIRELNVDGYSTFTGITTFNSDVYIDGDLIIGSSFNFDQFSAEGITTKRLVVIGVTTTNSLDINSVEVIDSSRQLKNITSLDDVTTQAIENAISNAPNTFTNLEVTGISTFNEVQVTGISTFYDNVTIDGGNLSVDQIYGTNASFSGITTITGGLYYGPNNAYGIAYFLPSGLMESTSSPENGINYTNNILTVNNSGYPVWSNAIDGGEY